MDGNLTGSLSNAREIVIRTRSALQASNASKEMASRITRPDAQARAKVVRTTALSTQLRLSLALLNLLVNAEEAKHSSLNLSTPSPNGRPTNRLKGAAPRNPTTGGS